MDPAVRELVTSLAPDAAIADLGTMEDLVARAMAEPRLYVILLASFASVALVPAALGIYGVVSHGVSRRGQEIAIRLALGARTADVRRLVVRQGMATVGVGLAAGNGARSGRGRARCNLAAGPARCCRARPRRAAARVGAGLIFDRARDESHSRRRRKLRGPLDCPLLEGHGPERHIHVDPAAAVEQGHPVTKLEVTRVAVIPPEFGQESVH